MCVYFFLTFHMSNNIVLYSNILNVIAIKLWLTLFSPSEGPSFPLLDW